MKKISILLPIYNEKISWIEESINSILNQTYNNIELLLILDDPQNTEIVNFLTKFEKNKNVILIINEKIIFIYKVAFLLIIFLILYKTSFKYKSYTLIILGYQMYTIRDKIVYSKKTESELYKILKSKKYLQIIEINDNIYIENEKYTITNFYCKDF